MRAVYVALVLMFASIVVAQEAPTAPPAAPSAPATRPASPSEASASKPASSSVPADAPVITIPGVCESAATHTAAGARASASKPKADCQTVITRQQFEDMANALQPNMNPQTKRRLAEVYPRMLIMAQEAHKRGLDSDPKFKEMLKFARLQILSQELGRSMKEQADKVPAPDIEKYYKDNPEAFEQANLLRLFVPKEKQPSPDKADAGAKEAQGEDAAKAAESSKADEQAMQQLAQDIQKRAAAGEDFDKLQKEAYEKSGIAGTPPPTAIGKLGRNEIPVSQRSVLDLKAGEVSQLFTEPNGYYVYKLQSKETKSLDQARDEIRATLAQQRMQDSLAKFQQENQAKLNDTYFGAAGAPPAPPRMGPPGAGTVHAPGTPPAPPAQPNSPAGASQPPQK